MVKKANKKVLAQDIWNLGPLVVKEPTQKIKDELRKGWEI